MIKLKSSSPNTSRVSVEYLFKYYSIIVYLKPQFRCILDFLEIIWYLWILEMCFVCCDLFVYLLISDNHEPSSN